jgi:UDP-GlcNAc:undecaprenyl-phosphate/decaprenyl-phosphate GlcNAc-1-phosphate transferase
MIPVAIAMFVAAFLVSLGGTYLARRLASKLGLMDDPGHRKVHVVATPRNGGIGIFWGFALPLLVGTMVVLLLGNGGATPMKLLGIEVPEVIHRHLAGMRAHATLAMILVGATLGIHILGLLDDRKSLGPWSKLLGQLTLAAGLVFIGEYCDPVRPGAFRVMTSLGFVPSAILSILWIVALTNAFNFLDNMDGLTAGVAFICAGMFLIATIFNGQWFVAGLLVLFMGATLGFLWFNFPPASIFMGDGGSMVLGFVLSALTIRTTYYDAWNPDAPHHWYSVFMPLFVMAVPLYDLTIVTVLRIAKGRSPMTGDTNHFSHRLTRHGFSKRAAVLIIYAVTFATGLSAPLLARVDNASALLLAGQLVAILVVIGILERVGAHVQ